MGCFHRDIPYFLNFPTESCIAPIADLSALSGFHDTPYLLSALLQSPNHTGNPYYLSITTNKHSIEATPFALYSIAHSAIHS